MEKKSSRAMEEPGKHPPSSPPMRRRRTSHLAPVSHATHPGAAVTFSCCESQFSEEEEVEEEEQESPHFLDACALCRRPLERARDIFMYRGDTPFCSEECRQEQIELDDSREEEKAGYWRGRRRRQRQRRPRHLPRDPPAEPAEVQGIHAPASGTAVAG